MSQTAVPSERRVAAVTHQGEKFAEKYYQAFGTSVGKFYTEQSRVMWNGTPFLGAQFKEALPQVQSYYTQFEVAALDVQPLGDCFMACVTGTVRAGGNKSQFAQNFVVRKENNLSHIVSDCFRLV
ncbi:hypothetical protein H4R18_003021 [Coemansia javaensis]|uniref:Nuclear transport factor 2 n=1 Tax=Coemansia javaensis TaxID=2761396 RepID=A0A9W8HGQ3_9FUNG|nr:hypothetical protein H4R18_003021 [Coemansia javaensis]